MKQAASERFKETDEKGLLSTLGCAAVIFLGYLIGLLLFVAVAVWLIVKVLQWTEVL